MSIDGKGSYDIGGGSVPVDKFRLIYLIFGWLGIGTLLPWNMFITVSAYWTDKWKTVDTGTLAHNASDTLGGKYSSDYKLSTYSGLPNKHTLPNTLNYQINVAY